MAPSRWRPTRTWMPSPYSVLTRTSPSCCDWCHPLRFEAFVLRAKLINEIFLPNEEMAEGAGLSLR
jgi:hypothetical protein